MIDIDNQTNFTINISYLEDILSFLTKNRSNIELIVTNNVTIQEINRDYRQIDKATDVLSFPYEQNGFSDEILGSIIISIDFVTNGALQFNHSEDSEFLLLFIHGLLHILGYDHETDNGEMRDKERNCIEHFKLPSSLIVRTEDANSSI